MDSLGNSTLESPSDRRKRLCREVGEVIGPLALQKSRLRIMWEVDPHCHWCGRETIWWGKDGGRMPDNGATRDHVVSRRVRKPGEEVPIVLACYRCNQGRNDEENAALRRERLRSVAPRMMGRTSDHDAKPRAAAPIAYPLESIGSIIGVRSPDPAPALSYSCPVCGRNSLHDSVAFWQHVIHHHSPDDLKRQVTGAVNDTFETALVNVVNSSSHDEAVKIATAALMGEG